jgi:superfamily II DNA/RNA helicase
MVFVNKQKESEEGCEQEWNNAPNHYLKTKVVWFHSGMSPHFQADKIEDLKEGQIWGILCTDTAGMVSIKS